MQCRGLAQSLIPSPRLTTALGKVSPGALMEHSPIMDRVSFRTHCRRVQNAFVLFLVARDSLELFNRTARWKTPGPFGRKFCPVQIS
jgi:hypothetical protein